eukprot:3914755-Rhodomonas_salina.2
MSVEARQREEGGRWAVRSALISSRVLLQAALAGAGLDLSAPTLLLSECVIIYMPAGAAMTLRVGPNG